MAKREHEKDFFFIKKKRKSHEMKRGNWKRKLKVYKKKIDSVWEERRKKIWSLNYVKEKSKRKWGKWIRDKSIEKEKKQQARKKEWKTEKKKQKY